MEIDEIQAVATQAATPSDPLEQAGLDRDAFLRIFLAQLEHQDPLDPQDSSELGAQLATFSQLEQSIRATDELRGINGRLDQLITSSGAGGGAFSLDPLAMLGRQVELEGNLLSLVGSDSNQSLRMELEQSADQLNFTAESADGTPLGLATIVGIDDLDNPVSLRAGTYELSFVNGEPRLRLPDGEQIGLTFLELVRDEDGRLVPNETRSLVFPPPGGRTYRFSVAASGRDSGSFEPRMTTSAPVDAVRIVNGQPLLSIAGTDIDPSKVIRIH